MDHGCQWFLRAMGAAGENSIRTRPHETKPSQHRVTPEIPGIQVVRIFRGAEGERGRGSSFWERWMQEVAAPSAQVMEQKEARAAMGSMSAFK